VKPVAKAVVIAHYDPEGLIRDDLRALVDDLCSFTDTVIFVSTNLTAAAARVLPSRVTTIARENRGYDFYSYKVGVESLGNLSQLIRLFLVNSSFICVDRHKLVQRFFRSEHSEFDVFSLTRSREYRPHLQSFLLSFGPRCLHSPDFGTWWSQMTAIDERERVIERYELGLSHFLEQSGFSLGSAYLPTLGQRAVALARSARRLRRVWNPSMLNPTQFYWDFLLREFGIVKVEMVKKNPYGLIGARERAHLAAAAGPAGLG
jgi:rhamnosyltransferase